MRRTLFSAIAILALAIVAGLWLRGRHPTDGARNLRPVAPVVVRPAAPARSAKLAALAAQIPPDSISSIANDLDAPGGSAQRDVQIVNELLVAWEANFPHDGNPVGENEEITAALAGDNRLHFAFISPTHPAIDARGELCDRWGVPYRFHALSGTQMEIRSAGPDHKFGTADDVEFAPWPKPQ